MAVQVLDHERKIVAAPAPPPTRRAAFAFVFALGLACWLAAGATGAALAAPPAPGWDSTPYRMVVLVSLGPSAEWTPLFEQDLLAGIEARADAVIGPPWMLKIRRATAAQASAMNVSQSTLASIWTPVPKEKKKRTKAGKSKTDAKKVETAPPAAPDPDAPPPPPPIPEFTKRTVLEVLDLHFGDDSASLATASLPGNVAGAPASDAVSPGLEASAPRLRTVAFPLDKVVWLHVARLPNGYRIRARELDVHTRLLGAFSDTFVPLRGQLAAGCVTGLWNAFAPLARIDGDVREEEIPLTTEDLAQLEKRDSKEEPVARRRQVVSLRLRAGKLPYRDPNLYDAPPGYIFRPVTRYNSQNEEPKKTELVEWSYLAVMETDSNAALAEGGGDPAVVRTRLHSGLRSALTGRTRGKIERLAVGFPRVQRPTQLRLLARSKANAPLAGYEVYSHPPESKTTTLVGRTLADGTLEIPPAPEGLRILLLKNGGEFLAKLPMLPGMVETQDAPVVDDDVRLEAEGFANGFQQSFIDRLARFKILSSLIEKRLDAEKFDEATKFFDEIKRLGTRDDFLQLIAEEEVQVRSPDAGIQAKVTRLFRDSRSVIERLMKPEEVNNLELEIGRRKAGQPPPEPAEEGDAPAGQ